MSTTYLKYAISLMFLGMVTCTGCDRHGSSRDLRKLRQTKATSAVEQDHLRDMFGYLKQIAEVDERAAAEQIAFHLNSWNERTRPSVNWKPPERLVKSIAPRQMGLLTEVGSQRFFTSDLDHLRLCYLLSRIAQWSTDGPSVDKLLDQWLEEQRMRMKPDTIRDLDRACRLFDWTVRNIRLEPMTLNDQVPSPPQFPPEITFRGPGYRQTTFETVWHGTGDAWQRGRVFIQLCRQLDIDACMIGLRDGNRMTTWLCGARIENELYLFEPQLGLAVPGPGQIGVATLRQAIDDASVTRRLNVPGWFDYPIRQEMVKDCVAVLDATPEALSWRMTALEQSLTGDLRMRLSSDVETLADRLMTCDGIKDVGLWSVPLDAQIHQSILKTARRNDPAIETYYALEFGMLFGGFPLAKARWYHLTGVFEEQDDEVGAHVSYQRNRVTESEIGRLPTDVNLQIINGVRRKEGETNEQFQYKIQMTEKIMRKAKLAASYWLGVMLIDEHRDDVAPTWLHERFLESGGKDGPWESAALYALARSYEHLDRLPEAIELYKTQGTMQEHGNRIRARLLDSKASGN